MLFWSFNEYFKFIVPRNAIWIKQAMNGRLWVGYKVLSYSKWIFMLNYAFLKTFEAENNRICGVEFTFIFASGWMKHSLAVECQFKLFSKWKGVIIWVRKLLWVLLNENWIKDCQEALDLPVLIQYLTSHSFKPPPPLSKAFLTM